MLFDSRKMIIWISWCFDIHIHIWIIILECNMTPECNMTLLPFSRFRSSIPSSLFQGLWYTIWYFLVIHFSCLAVFYLYIVVSFQIFCISRDDTIGNEVGDSTWRNNRISMSCNDTQDHGQLHVGKNSAKRSTTIAYVTSLPCSLRMRGHCNENQ